MSNIVSESFLRLKNYIEKENFVGYDPYDTLNSRIPLKYLGKWSCVILTQIQKRNPVNIRPLIGIRKGINPKAFGLLLQGYSILYKRTHDPEDLEIADYIYGYLKNNFSKGYSGYAWGYNFPWATNDKIIDAFIPSSVVTGFICKGLWQYFQITKKPEVSDIIRSASDFILKDLAIYNDDTGKCISYTPLMKDICYNSSLLAAEILAINYYLTRDELLKKFCIELVNFVVARQKSDGRWAYSESINNGIERNQTDFHQGYVLESISEIKRLLNLDNAEWDLALEKGTVFYFQKQFFKNGQSLWRLPKEYPVDIHNQSQGVITFAKLHVLNPEYLEFASTILEWTIKNMQDSDGHFFYKNYKYIKDRTSYMRWNQAWMFLANVILEEQTFNKY